MMLTQRNRTTHKNRKNQWINLHYTANKTDTARANANYFKSAYRGASANYFVDPNSIYCVVDPDNADSWAVGRKFTASPKYWGADTNKNSVNIEMCSNNGVITEATIQNTVDLVKFLMTKYGIPADHVVRHYDVCGKKCPGWEGWLPPNESKWNDFKGRLSSTTKVSAPTPAPSKPAGGLELKYKLKVHLNVRSGPGTQYPKTSTITDNGIYTVTQVQNGWGRLKSGAGWICLSDAYVSYVGDGAKQAINSVAVPKYNVGQVYHVQINGLAVRKGPGTGYGLVGHNNLTASGKKADPDRNSRYNKGTAVTCKEAYRVDNNVWMKTPSGWLCAFCDGHKYIA